MRIRWPGSRAAVALLLLALVAAPLASEAVDAVDSHGCCPDGAPVADASMPCQYLAALDCCDQVGLPATPAGDAARVGPVGFALAALAVYLPSPPVLLAAWADHAHGPPQGAQLRATVLRL
jgi:hypothetical protein